MSETPELPPLPEPFKVLLGPLPMFTAGQLVDFALAARELGRRAGLEEAAGEAEHWQKISRPEHKCGQYIAGAIRAQVSKVE